MVRRMSREFYEAQWAKGNVPIKLRGLGLDSYEPVISTKTGRPHASGLIAMEESKRFVAEFANHFISTVRADSGDLPKDRSNIGRGLMFYGRNGTRKTTLATAILTEVQFRSPSWGGFYIRFSDWKRYLTDTFSSGRENSDIAKKMLQRAENWPLLVLDDIGQEHRTATGFTESVLHELLRNRYEAARPTIITTNIPPDDMRSTYGASLDSFRFDAFDAYEMLGQDSRKIERN